MPDSPRIVALIAAFNEADIIRQTVADMVEQGIAAYVIDDGSTDGTSAALEPLLQSGRVHIERRSPDQGGRASHQFRWAELLARKEQLSRELDADWFLHHDADEFRESPWRHLNLREGIALVDRLGYNAIDFAVFNFWPTHDRFDGVSDVRDEFPGYEPGSTFDRLQVKCWRKTNSIDLVSSGGHDARFADRRVFPVRFILRHYPIRGQAHGARKVFAERKARFTTDERARGWHVQYDALHSDHDFIRDPGSLTRFDPDLARLRLQIEHRGTETLQAELDDQRAQADAFASQLAAVKSVLLAERADRLHQAELAAAESTRQRLAYEGLEQQHRREREALEQTIGMLRHHVESLESRVIDLMRSWSWRVTAPLRAIAAVALRLTGTKRS